MSDIKLDIPDITVLIDKGDEYRVVVNKASSVVKNITGSYITAADSAVTASYALTSSYFAAGGKFDSASVADFATQALTASYAENSNWNGVSNKPSGIVSSSIQTIENISGSVIIPSKIESKEFKLIAGEVSLTFTGSVTTGIFGATEFVYPFIPTASYTATTVEYVASRPGGVRVGTILAAWSGSNYVVTDVSTTDIGDTSDIRFALVQVDGYVKLRVESIGNGSYPWTVQSLFKLFPILP